MAEEEIRDWSEHSEGLWGLLLALKIKEPREKEGGSLRALTGVTQLVECHSTKRKVTGLNLSQGTYLGSGFSPQ